ncbi:MAG: AMP-binding protein, partial [Solirubrobacteraceae bacterium]
MKGRISDILFLARTFARAGMLKPSSPDRVARVVWSLHRWGTTLAAGYMGAAARHPNRRAIVDELGAVTFAELDRRTNALANAFASHGVGEGHGVAIMCRNHRGFIEASLACSKLGAHTLYLNTAFAAPLVTAVLEREDPAAVVYDQEFAAAVEAACKARQAFVAWV